jgi:imidazolonepropionase-like amidohydrolase
MTPQFPEPTLFGAGRLADGLGGPSKSNQAILVTDGRIRAVGPPQLILQKAPADIRVMDLGSACVTPGLIDGHTHRSLAGDGRNYA